MQNKFIEIKTNTWHTKAYLSMFAEDVKFVNVDRLIPEPEEASNIRKDTWAKKLQERKNVLEEANPSKEYVIRFDADTGEDALFERGEPDERKMWSGKTITFVGHDVKEDSADILVSPISYNEWIACYNPRYAEVFEKNNIPLPYAGIGACVLIETTDNFVPLIRRGIETPVYPGMLYAPGGGPKPGESSTEALLQEIVEETGLEAGKDFDPSELEIMALIADTHFAGSKHSRPEFVARLSTGLKYREIETIYYEKIGKKGVKETDVWGLEPVSLNPNSLKQTIKLHGYEMCPPIEAALTYELFQCLSFDQLKNFVKTISKYQREPYKVPIKLMGE